MERVKKPYYIDFSVTPFCNLACPFCSAGAANRIANENQKTYSIEMIKNLFDQFDENEVMRVSLEGGEPFTRKDIIEIMHIADTHNFWYMINTNATLITEELAKEIANTNVEKLCISIDGPPKIHDISRGVKGSFEKMSTAVKYLKKYKVPIDGVITLTKINKDYLFETLNLIASMGIENVAIMLLASVGDAFKHSRDVSIEYNEWKELYLKMTDMKKGNKLPVNVNLVPTGESRYPWMLYLPLKEANREEDLQLWMSINSTSSVASDLFACTAGKDNLAIDGYGNVFGCSLMYTEKDLIAGNVYEQSIADIWDNSPLFRKLRNLQYMEVNGKCKTCEYLSMCRAGCRVCAFATTRDICGSDAKCPICMGET